MTIHPGHTIAPSKKHTTNHAFLNDIEVLNHIIHPNNYKST